jgi:C-terminal processing protease CtpA/Prc
LPAKLTEKELDAATYYVRLPSFSSVDPAQAKAFEESASRARTHATVVLDLRGNPGGDPSIFLLWLEALGVTGKVKFPALVTTDSFAATVLGNNSYEMILHGGIQLDPSVRASIESQLAEQKESAKKDIAAKNVKRMEPVASDTPHYEWTLAPSVPAFEGEVRVLVDARCASACEWSAHLSKQLPKFFVLSDTNTLGALLSGNPAPLPLPASAIGVWIPISMVSRPDQWAQEGHGVAPDVWLDSAAMATLYP